MRAQIWLSENEISVANSDAPWEADRLVNWWDVERFAAAHFYRVATTLQTISENLRTRPMKYSDGVVGGEEAVALVEDLDKIADSCKRIGLLLSADNIEELRTELSDSTGGQWATEYVGTRIKEISDSIRREMRRRLFLYVSEEKAKWYQQPFTGWDAAIKRFGSKIITDIEEAAKCFACDRHGAAVFHMMLVVEFGALHIGELIKMRDPQPSWHSVLGEIRHITQDKKYPELTDVQRKYFKLLEQVFPLMLSMQRAWRDKISHAANRLVLETGEFQPYVAEDIIVTTRAFMRILTTELNALDKST